MAAVRSQTVISHDGGRRYAPTLSPSKRGHVSQRAAVPPAQWRKSLPSCVCLSNCAA